MKMRCQICHKPSEEEFFSVRWNEVAVCQDCAERLIEAYRKQVDE